MSGGIPGSIKATKGGGAWVYERQYGMNQWQKTCTCLQEQFMDTNEIERERGITIKLNSARMKYKAKNGGLYALNLIDTPG